MFGALDAGDQLKHAADEAEDAGCIEHSGAFCAAGQGDQGAQPQNAEDGGEDTDDAADDHQDPGHFQKILSLHNMILPFFVSCVLVKTAG